MGRGGNESLQYSLQTKAHIWRELGRGVWRNTSISCCSGLQTLVLRGSEQAGCWFGSTSLTASDGIISNRKTDRKTSIFRGFTHHQMPHHVRQKTGSGPDHMTRLKSTITQKLMMVVPNDQN